MNLIKRIARVFRELEMQTSDREREARETAERNESNRKSLDAFFDRVRKHPEEYRTVKEAPKPPSEAEQHEAPQSPEPESEGESHAEPDSGSPPHDG